MKLLDKRKAESFQMNDWFHVPAWSLKLEAYKYMLIHNVFESCHEYAERVWAELATPARKWYAGANKPSLTTVVDRCTLQMNATNDLKEV